MLKDNVDPMEEALRIARNYENKTVGGDYAWLESDIRKPIIPFRNDHCQHFSYWEVGDTFVLPDTRMEALPYFVTERFPSLPRLANRTYLSIGYIYVRVHNIYTNKDSVKRYHANEPILSFEECSRVKRLEDGRWIDEYNSTGNIIQSDNELSKRIQSFTYEGEMFDVVLGRRLFVENVREIDAIWKKQGSIVGSIYRQVVDFKIVKKDLY